jgi:cystathionine gamma-synthase
MTTHELCEKPVWRGEELGHCIPASTHAVSVALPRWQDVIGYEEKKPEVITKLNSGYPRFVIHDLVRKAAARLAPGRVCLPFTSSRAAEKGAAFVRRTSGESAEVVQQNGLYGVATTTTGETALRAFWQHTGLGISTRQAEAFLSGRVSAPGDVEVRRDLRRLLACWYDCAEDDVFLAPTGMAAQLAGLEALMRRCPGRRSAQLGFPYVDTLKLQEKIGHGGILISDLENAAARLRDLLGRETLAACVCEIPSNPLLGSADLRQITPILREHRVPLVADDVVSTPANIDLRNHADLIPTSLTKFIAGTGDVMGGALICNPRSPYYAELKPFITAQHEDLLWGEDARVLLTQACGFPERMKKHNASGLLLAEHLRTHPAIERVWYPKWEFAEAYEAVRRPDGGYGGLISFLPRNADSQAPLIYDRLPLCKGPSLGTVFTLACPFTLLAHYTELDWAESCGVPRCLIRLSVGLEDPEELWRRIRAALEG